MPRESFERHLHELQDDVLILGSMVEKAISRSIEALKKRDLKLAGQIVAGDREIDLKRYEIEEKCTELIVTQQPVASDLRIIVAVLYIIVDLERIADHAGGIAKIAIMIGDEPPLKPLIDIPRMAQKAIDMLHRSLDAFVKHDADAARQISAEDDEVDSLYDQVFRELLVFMMEDPRTVTRATRLIWVAHNLERTADRVTNICERVVFTVTGKIEEIEVSKY
jgi:phosphate transport system protein